MTYPEYKEIAAEFFRKLKTPNRTKESIELGLKCLGIGYLNLKGSDIEIYQAQILLELANKKADEII